MVKVNNGWTSNSIDEVETLASQAGSPASSTSTLQGRRNLISSPRTNIASFQGQSSNRSAPNQDFELYSKGDHASRTYESFWREHSSTSTTSYHRQQSQGISIASPRSTKLSLAPPADIHPSTNPRRSESASFSKPPNIPGKTSSDLSQYSQRSFNSPTPTPHTPIRGNSNNNRFQDGPSGIRTPTQKTIQEQDAIETLLFMSSPGNSGNMGHNFPPPNRSQSSPQHSPLRTEFSPHIRNIPLDGRHRPNFGGRPDANANGVGGGPYNAARAKMHNMGKNDRAREEALDQLLDEMGDSSSDEELVTNYSRRVPAGKV